MYEFLISKFNGKRGPKRQLSLEQIVALNIYRFSGLLTKKNQYVLFINSIYRNLNFCEPGAFITFIQNTIDVAFPKITADFISIFFYILKQW